MVTGVAESEYPTGDSPSSLGIFGDAGRQWDQSVY